jgi:Fe-S cluster assembly iron-binding protein IscA
MIQVTEQATKHLVRVRGERGLSLDAAARFVQSGTGVGLTFSSRPEPGDRILHSDGLAIFVAPEVATKLEGATIDVSDKSGKAALYLRPKRPASKSPSRRPAD